MKTIILTFALLFALSFKIFPQTQISTDINAIKKTIVLVHGAWADVSSWDRVTPVLEAAGHEVIAVNLPGHGKDNTPYDKLTLQGYADVVKNAIGSKTDIILVGHSMSGMNVSLVAEQIPSQLNKVIYISAFVPMNGQNTLTLSGLDKETVLYKYLKVDESTGTGGFPIEDYINFFAPDAPKEDKDKLIANFKPEGFVPFQAPVSLSEKNFGQVKKVYIHDINDLVVGYQLQQQMVKDAGITTTYTLPSSHTPFFSMPNVLAEIIIKESN